MPTAVFFSTVCVFFFRTPGERYYYIYLRGYMLYVWEQNLSYLSRSIPTVAVVVVVIDDLLFFQFRWCVAVVVVELPVGWPEPQIAAEWTNKHTNKDKKNNMN